MKTRTYFAHRIDMLDAAGELQEHLAGVEDYILAEAVWREAIARWPGRPLCRTTGRLWARRQSLGILVMVIFTAVMDARVRLGGNDVFADTVHGCGGGVP